MYSSNKTTTWFHRIKFMNFSLFMHLWVVAVFYSGSDDDIKTNKQEPSNKSKIWTKGSRETVSIYKPKESIEEYYEHGEKDKRRLWPNLEDGSNEIKSRFYPLSYEDACKVSPEEILSNKDGLSSFINGLSWNLVRVYTVIGFVPYLEGNEMMSLEEVEGHGNEEMVQDIDQDSHDSNDVTPVEDIEVESTLIEESSSPTYVHQVWDDVHDHTLTNVHNDGDIHEAVPIYEDTAPGQPLMSQVWEAIHH